MEHFEINSIEYKILSHILLRMKNGKVLIDLNELEEKFGLNREQLVNIIRGLEERGLIKIHSREKKSLISQIEKYVSILDDIYNRRETSDSKYIFFLYKKYVSLRYNYDKLTVGIDSITSALNGDKNIEKKTIEKLSTNYVSLHFKDLLEINLELMTYRRCLLGVLEETAKRINNVLTLREINSLTELVKTIKDERRASLVPLIRESALRTIYVTEYLTLISYPLIHPIVRTEKIVELVRALDLGLTKEYIYIPNIEKADIFIKTRFEKYIKSIEKIIKQNRVFNKKYLLILFTLKYDYELCKRIVDVFEKILLE